MVELPLSAGDIYDLVAGSTEIKLEETITRREPNYFKGPPGLKRQIIIRRKILFSQQQQTCLTR